MPKTTPIKRHEALVPFSRDHHNGLLLTWKIRQGMKKNIEGDRIGEYVLFAYGNELEQHFKDEEQWLFPELPSDDPMRKQAESDHSEIRGLIKQLESGRSDTEVLVQFADGLEKHIRFEERELFNHLQTTVPAERLKPVAEKFEGHTCEADDGWKDPFWK